jgi:hypothetical protein
MISTECQLLSLIAARGTTRMGLDAWVHAVPENILATDQEVDILLSEEGIANGQLKKDIKLFCGLADRGEEKIEVWYWRKNHALHEWMGRLYDSKGGTDPQFNCNNVRINLEDLDELEKAILTGLIEEDIDYDLLFILKAREYINNGFAIFYDSWW